MQTPSKHQLLTFLAFALTFCLHIFLAYFVPTENTVILFATFAALFLLYIFLYRQKLTDKQFNRLLIGGILLRVIWMPAFPHLSDDYARFVWDGQLIVSGHNPFKYLPSDIFNEGLAGFRINASLYHAMNSQEYYTCYPPVLQLIFAIAAKSSLGNVGLNIILLKCFVLFAEIGSIKLLLLLCKKWRIPGKCILLYVLNPMVIAELTGNLHFEGVMIFFMLATLWFFEQKKLVAAALVFTAAVVTKLIPLIFLPLLFFYLGVKKGFLFCGSVLLLCILSFLPFYDPEIIKNFWSSIDSYFRESEYNASIYYLVRDIVFYFTHEVMIEIIGPVLAIISAIIIVAIAIRHRENIETAMLPALFILSLLSYYAFTTTVFPWYLTPILVLSVFTNYKFPVVWSGLVLLSYYANKDSTFTESYLLIWIEYLIVTATFIYDLFFSKKTWLLKV